VQKNKASTEILGGVGAAFDFGFIGRKSFCSGDECISEDSILSNFG
jgi:hypothetical protein